MTKQSLDKKKIKVLLLEGIHENAADFFQKSGYTNVTSLPKALDKTQLKEAISDTHIIGIRSRTNLTSDILPYAKKLISIGCFSIGTNQVDTKCARLQGIPVFNAPFSNTRSVAELVIAESIMLIRGIPEKNICAHKGKWMKTASGAYEIRKKKLGIIGYGHIGMQVSVLAEAMGMEIYYYDIEKKLSLGNAKACNTLNEVLEIADIVTLHVPSTPLTHHMISDDTLKQLKQGACVINASRGDVVDYNALCKHLQSGHISGAAVDVFPEEPASSNNEFKSDLQKFDNVILTPHIGGSTQEAQANIGLEVTEKLVKYSDTGSTLTATNFPGINLSPNKAAQRFLHIHKNQPGVLREVNYIFTSRGINIAAEHLQTDNDIGYVIIDTDSELDKTVMEELSKVPHTIKTRMLY